MLCFGIDDPNVNLLFQNELCHEFSFTNVGTFPLHIVNISFVKTFKLLKESVVDFDGMAIDFHIFFKYSAVHREQSAAGFKSL